MQTLSSKLLSLKTVNGQSIIGSGNIAIDFASPGPIGGTTPSTGAFTTLTATSGTGNAVIMNHTNAGIVGNPVQRNGVTKGYLGLDVSDNFGLLDSTGAIRVTATTSGATVQGTFSSTGVIGGSNLSGTNTGDETVTTIKSKLGITTLSGSNTGDQTTITGNAGSATVLQTARNINGVSFNGSADITVAAAAGTLTGSTLASGVTGSSLTSVGTLTGLTVNGVITTKQQIKYSDSFTQHHELRLVPSAAIGDLDTYLDTNEGFELITITPAAASQNYLFTGTLYDTTSNNYEAVKFYWSVRTNVLPSVTFKLRTNISSSFGTGTRRFNLVTWYNATTGVTKLIAKAAAGVSNAQSFNASINVLTRGAYTDFTVTGTAIDVTTPTAGFAETADTQEALIDATNHNLTLPVLIKPDGTNTVASITSTGISITGSSTSSGTTTAAAYVNSAGALGTSASNAKNHFTQTNVGSAVAANGWIAAAFGDTSGPRPIIGQAHSMAYIGAHDANLAAWSGLHLQNDAAAAVVDIGYAWNTAIDTTYRLKVNGITLSSASLRAPYFYDSDNTSYYIDGASTSNLYDLTIANTTTTRRINTNRSAGANGQLWYSNSYTAWQTYMGPVSASQGYAANITPPSGSYVTSWALRNFIEDVAGYGWTWEGGSSASTTPAIVAELTSATGIFRTTGSVRAPYFYDQDNTGYYIDGAGSSNLNNLTVNGRLYPQATAAYSAITSTGYGTAAIEFPIITVANDNSLKFVPYMRGGTVLNGAGYVQHVSFGNVRYGINNWTPYSGAYIGVGGNDSYPTEYWTFEYGGWMNHSYGYTMIRGSTRSPIFYDVDNTGYYIEGNGTSYLHSLTLAGGAYFRPQNWIQMDSTYGLYWPNHYGAHISANDLSTYTQIALRGSKSSYGGIYDNYSGVNIGMYDSGGNGGLYREANGRWFQYYHVGNDCTGFGTSATNSAYNIYAPKGIYSGGRVDGTIFYDANDTGYYFDGASTTSTNRVVASRIVLNRNYGHSIFGVYESTRYQGVWSMGESWYLPDDGTTTGNLYGLAWSHPNAGGTASNLDSHGLLVLINGGFGCAMSYSIKASGNVTAYSDERLKTNWRDLPTNFVDQLAEVKVGIYDRIDGEKPTQVGVSAQSLQKLLPDAVIQANDEIKTLSVAYGNAALASAVELAKEVVLLKKQIQSLIADINILKDNSL